MLRNSFLALICVLCITDALFAQRGVSVKKAFEPTFRVEPLSQRLKARRGDVLQFQFEMNTKSKAADIDVSLVGLRQEITGQVFHDSSEVDETVIQLANPGRHHINADSKFLIEGLVRIPPGAPEFYSFGVLVEEVGSKLTETDKAVESDAKEVRAGVTFVTRYVLRVDVEVEGARSEQASVLRIKEAKVFSLNGLPVVGAIVENPSETAFEIEVRSQLKRGPSDRSMQEVRHVMPVRESVQTEDRYLGRLLPRSSVLMRGSVEELLLDGDYILEVELLVAGRVIKREKFDVQIDALNFPAQAASITSVGADVFCSPVQIELSQFRGGTRRMSLEITNNSRELKNIQVATASDLGTEIPSVVIQPESFALAPGRTRRLSVTLMHKPNAESAIEYGELVVTSNSQYEPVSQTGAIPLAITYGQTPIPQVEAGELRWVGTAEIPAFRVRVENQGTTHFPLNAALQVVSESGNRMQIPAGFGRWLMPGEVTDLEFRLPKQLLPGKHALICELKNADTPIVKQQVIEVNPGL